MSRLYDAVEPSVISEEMLLTAVKEQGPTDEKGKVAKHDGVEFDEVKSLRLDYQSECLSVTNIGWHASLWTILDAKINAFLSSQNYRFAVVGKGFIEILCMKCWAVSDLFILLQSI